MDGHGCTRESGQPVVHVPLYRGDHLTISRHRLPCTDEQIEALARAANAIGVDLSVLGEDLTTTPEESQ